MLRCKKTGLTAFAFSLLMTAVLNSAAQARDVWGAVAFNARGATGIVWNRYSQWGAERDAMIRCEENASIPCKVISGANYACGAVANGHRGSNHGAYASIRPTLYSARQAALNRCYSEGNSGCYIRNVMCADGGHL